MNLSASQARVVRFGLFEADLQQLVLSKNGLRIRLQEQPFQILAMLLERPGELVTREQIGQKLWSDDTYVEFDDGLNTAIKKLRNALGDEADNPRFIETVPRRGYRFIAPVASASAQRDTSHVGVAVPTASVVPSNVRRVERHRGLYLILAGVLACAAVAALVAWNFRKPPTIPHVVRVTQLTRSGTVHGNQNLATDGLRIYYVERINGDWALKSMPAVGGTGTPLQISLPRYDLQDLSRDGSEMLLRRISTDSDNESLWIMPSVGGPVHRVGDIHAIAAAYSPDGRSISYSEGNSVYLCDKDGGNPRKMFSTAGEVLRLRWSPRGDLLRFTLYEPSLHTNSIWEIRANGSGMRPMLPGWNLPKWEWTMDWSHDARWFAFSAVRDGGRDIWLLQQDPASGATTKPIQLTAGPIEFDLPLFSPNGKLLYAVGVQRHGELLRFDSSTRQFAPYLGGISADQLDFSRDHRWVAYVTYPEGALWRAKADGSEALKLTDAPLRALAPKWSPDGSQISFLARSARGEKWRAYIVPARGGLYKPVASGAEETTGATWLNDDNTMVLSSPQWNELRTLDVTTGKIAPLPNSQNMEGSLVSPTGRYIIASTREGTSFDVLDRKTGQRLHLADDANYPSWSPDECCVYFNRFGGSKPALYRFRLADSSVKEIFDLTAFQATGSQSTWSTVSPDGSILLLRDLGGSNLYSIEWSTD